MLQYLINLPRRSAPRYCQVLFVLSLAILQNGNLEANFYLLALYCMDSGIPPEIMFCLLLYLDGVLSCPPLIVNNQFYSAI